MTGSVAKLTARVDNSCRSMKCNKDGCNVSLDGTPTNRLIIDMDCKALGMTNETRCDYLFVGEENKTTWIVPIELKGGGVGSVTRVAEQLDGGTKLAEKLLPSGLRFQFVPVLAYKRQMHKNDRLRLREKRVQLRGNVRMIKTIRCGDRLPIGQGT